MRRAGGVCHQLTSHSSSNLLHELLGQATCIFFFFNWRYNPWWVLAWFMISFHNLLSLHFSLQFLTFIFFKSSTCLSHLSLGLPILYIYIYIFKFNFVFVLLSSTWSQWCSWLQRYATSQKVMGSIPDGVIRIFPWHNPSGRTMALGSSTQPVTEMSTRNISWGVKTASAYGWQPYHFMCWLSWNVGAWIS